MMLREHLEIPFISYYRKDRWEVDDAFPKEDERPKNAYLWQIYDWDEKYHKFSMERKKLQQLFSSVPEVCV